MKKAEFIAIGLSFRDLGLFLVLVLVLIQSLFILLLGFPPLDCMLNEF